MLPFDNTDPEVSSVFTTNTGSNCMISKEKELIFAPDFKAGFSIDWIRSAVSPFVLLSSLIETIFKRALLKELETH
jgi:hypothetical protein